MSQDTVAARWRGAGATRAAVCLSQSEPAPELQGPCRAERDQLGRGGTRFYVPCISFMRMLVRGEPAGSITCTSQDKNHQKRCEAALRLPRCHLQGCLCTSPDHPDPDPDPAYPRRCSLHPCSAEDMQRWAVCGPNCPLREGKLCSRLHRAGELAGPGAALPV